MLPIRYVAGPSKVGDQPVIMVDGSFGAAPVHGLHLAHWPGNRTPKELRRDLSTEIAFAFLDLEEGRRSELSRGCEALALNHYDTDGICALLVLSRPDVARPHRALLHEIAACGDLFEVRSDRAFAVDMALQDLGRRWTGDRERLIEAALDLLAAMLADGEAEAQRWQEPLDQLRGDRAALEDALFDDLVYMDLGVWSATLTAPQSPPFDPGRHAFLGSGRHDRALLLGAGVAGTSARFVLGTRSFFDIVSRPPSARPDLAALASLLNGLEGERADGHRWRHQPQKGATPELWFGTEHLPLYAEHAGQALGWSQLEPLEIKRHVLDAVRDAWVLPDDDDEADGEEDIFDV
jgi:hypothetical protein